MHALIQVVVVSETGKCLDVQPWLAGVDFPGMQIENKWLPRPVDLAKSPMAQPIREQTEIAAPCDGQPVSSNRAGRQRKLGEGFAIGRL